MTPIYRKTADNYQTFIPFTQYCLFLTIDNKRYHAILNITRVSFSPAKQRYHIPHTISFRRQTRLLNYIKATNSRDDPIVVAFGLIAAISNNSDSLIGLYRQNFMSGSMKPDNLTLSAVLRRLL